MWGVRNIVYFCKRKHPYLEIDKLWPNERILCLVLAQTTKLYKEHWQQKIKPFFHEKEYKEEIQGGILQSVEFPKLNSKILFFSYENAQQARNRVQGFVGHCILIDELCPLVSLIEECERRVQAKSGKVLVSYTQKVRAPAVKAYLKAPSPYKSHHTLNAFDNPVYDAEKKAKIEASLAQFPASIRDIKRKQILEGEYTDETKYAYNYDKTLHGASWPDGYSRSWRHIEAVDPAASGKVGYLLLAEDPDKDILDRHGKAQALWYIVDSKYIPGEAPSDLVAGVAKESEPYNIVKRIADGHETWFIKEAKKAGIHYHKPIKDKRKIELIKNPSEAFSDGWLKVIDAGNGENESLIEELGDAMWKEDESGIKNSTKYHLLDAMQYGVDKRPVRDHEAQPVHRDQVLRLANKARRKKEAVKKNTKLRIARRRRRR